MKYSSVIVLLITTLNLKILAQSVPNLVLPVENSGSVQLKVSGISNQMAKDSGYEYLSVFVENEANEYHKNAIQGKYHLEDEFLVFKPYFPFEKGMVYLVKVRNNQSKSGYSFQEFQLGEKPHVEKAQLLKIYPAADTLPENLLRFYFYFQTPMKKDQALQHIHLVDANGNIDSNAFMEFKHELWSADGKRLTLLFDPGRIKRGVSTNLELGPALLEHERYSITVSAVWQDVYGQELSRAVTKEFVVVQAYRQQLEVMDLVIYEPKAESEQALRLSFNRIMDHALVQSMIQVKDKNGQFINGYWEMSNDERIVSFTPESPWQKGKYQIIFDGRLEDVAGNNLEGLLDQSSDASNRDEYQLVRNFTL